MNASYLVRLAAAAGVVAACAVACNDLDANDCRDTLTCCSDGSQPPNGPESCPDFTGGAGGTGGAVTGTGGVGGIGGTAGGGGAPECTGDADCTSPTAAKCDGGTCVACDDSTQCTGITGTEVCATSGPNMGTCVECTAAEGCGATDTCDLTTETCSGVAPEAVDTCEACTNDAQCGTDHACVPMMFDGSPNGFFCLQANPPTCAQPYFPTAMTKQSINGTPAATYCGLNEAAVSCQGVRALIDNLMCTVDGSCLDGGVEVTTPGALCRDLGQGDRCTIGCTLAAQCPNPLTCGDSGTGMGDFCGGN